MELVDLLNNRKELIGETCERNAVPEGKYRLSIHIWIVNDKNEILIQQRSASRKMFPNMWTNMEKIINRRASSKIFYRLFFKLYK